MSKELNRIYNGDVILFKDDTLIGVEMIALNDNAEYAWRLSFGKSVYAYINQYAKKGEYAYLTGYYYLDYMNGEMYLLTTSGLYLIVDTDSDKAQWGSTGKRVNITSYGESQAQALVKKIIENNILILQNNLLCARFANKLTEDQRAEVRNLQRRLMARDEALQDDGLTEKVKTSYPKGFADLEPYLDKLMNGEAVGIATWAVVVIAAVVITGLGTAAYFTYKSLADESEKDVKFSKDLTRVLTSKLTEEEYQQLLDETKGIVTKARIKQAVGSYGKVLTIAAFVVGGGLLYRWIKNNI